MQMPDIITVPDNAVIREKTSLTSPVPLMRPAPFWGWNDKLDEAELRRQILEMAAKGWGSYFMHSRVGLVTGYLSDDWMRLINACADEAAKTGTFAWLYDEDKWPSGFAGGLLPEKNEAYRSRALVLLKKGRSTAGDTVLTECRCRGVDYEVCKRVSPLGSAWFNGASYVDLMNPEAVGEFINCTHERYKASCGEHFGKSIPGIFTDEPCYLMYYHYSDPVVPWSEHLPRFFRERKGYDILDHLPLLFFELDGYRKVRFDFYDVASELFKQSFTKQYFDWCEKNGLVMTGHFLIEETMFQQTQMAGDVMSHYEHMHWPGIDKLGRHIRDTVTVKQLSSVADQLDKERSLCEVYGCAGGQCSFFHRKWIGDWQAALGINFVNHHLSLYSMRGERKRDFPPNLFYQQPWWEDEKGFADYQARLCAFASEGERLVDILVMQPLAGVWSEYSPLHKESNFAQENTYEIPFAKLSERLMAEKLDFHYGNEALMSKYASVSGSNLRIGKHSYSCVIVPPVSNIRSWTLSLLKDFADAGGKLMFVSSLPSFVDGVEQRVSIPGAEVAATVEDAVRIASDLYPERIRVEDTLTGGNAATVYVHSRMFGGGARCLLVNTDKDREVRVRVILPSDATVQPAAVFDLMDGTLYKLELINGGFEAILYPAGSLLIISGEEAAEARTPPPAVLGSGAAFTDFAHPSQVIDSFDCELLEENVLLLNDFVLEMNGEKVYEGPVCGAWHTHFYPAQDGAPFRAAYSFDSECDLEGCFASIELAENLDRIAFNGVDVKPLKCAGVPGPFDPGKSWKDVNFTRVPLPVIRKGTNTLVIEGTKVNNITGPGHHERVANWKEHRPVEAEEAFICGSFLLRQHSDGRYAIAPFHKPSGRNLTCEGFPFYSGRVVLKAAFGLSDRAKRVFIGLNGVAAASAEVRVNGTACGVLRWAPFVVDVSSAAKIGQNLLEIEMATTLVNAFGPNRIARIKESDYIGPDSFTTMSLFKRGYELFDFGVASASIYAE